MILPNGKGNAIITRTLLRMFVLILMSFVTTSVCEPKTCDDYCSSLLHENIDTTWTSVCNCYHQNQIRKRSIDNYPIFYHPIVLYPSTDKSVETLVITNPSPYNKITPGITSQESEHHKKYKRKNDFIQVRNNDTQSHPLYLDIDIKKSPGQGRSSQNLSDFYTLQIAEQELKDCIDLHLLVHFRQNGINEANVIWNKNYNIKKYFHDSDANLLMEIDNKCNLAYEIFKQSLQQIEDLYKTNAFKSPETNNFNSDHITYSNKADDNDILNSSTSIIPQRVHITDTPKNNIESDLFKKSYHNKLEVKSEPITNKIKEEFLRTESTTFRSMKDNQSLIKTNNTEKQNFSKSHDSSLESILPDQKLDHYTETTSITTLENELGYMEIENEMLYTQKKNNKQNMSQLYKNEDTFGIITDKLFSSINSVPNSKNTIDSLAQNKINEDYYVTVEPTKIITPTLYGNFYTTPLSIDYTTLRWKFINNLNNVSHILKNSNHEIGNTAIKFDATSNFSEDQTRKLNDSTEGIYLDEINNIQDSDLKENLFLNNNTNLDILNHTIINVTDDVDPINKKSIVNVAQDLDRPIFHENYKKLPRIDVTEHSNNTVSSTVDEMEEELYNDYVTNVSESKEESHIVYNNQVATLNQFDNVKKILNEKATSFDNEISGNLYFMFKKQLIPMRFIQVPDGRLDLALDGTSFCENLVRDKQYDGILSTLCKFAVNNDSKTKKIK